jgi:hypothetical protein
MSTPHVAAAFSLALALLAAPSAGVAQTTTSAPLGVAAAERFAKLALACVERDYPNKIAHVLEGPEDAKPPRELTPAFYGCYDWHSAVHGHWLLVRLAREFPMAPFADKARAALARNLTPGNIAAEVAYVTRASRVSFERPYGLAWLLQLAAELRSWDDPQASGWSRALEPLEAVAARRIQEWLPKLLNPIRIGEHDQTAFAFGLIWDWAKTVKNDPMIELLRNRSIAFYGKDRACPLTYEPGGQDFVSPCIAEADLMRRILAPAAFARWLDDFLPVIPHDGTAAWLTPAEVSDRADPKIGHLDGLNLSRAWMLNGIARGLPANDPRRASLRRTAAAHRDAALPWVSGERYEGGHWLGTFAVYLLMSEPGGQSN